ncbi:tetratricopeptide repeat protein [Desulfoluna spongiiphila]|uniref:Tetratricopeptide repeat-containing protein n=1 Tax=Desulfoluna spongiiphila TaxID=419481 RepID=A0A1G5JE50_9BACT|nr:tetratricopeptide repeat protein [Desulfoluna spongiiphila]SCY86210.1 hypothetical protein SAMN05216233_12861 [Desulfoluna spongiiphila]
MTRQQTIFFSCVLLIGLLASYSNSFHASWHFDDQQNILERKSVHIRELSPESCLNAIGGKLSPISMLNGRSISYLSFALNWYAGQDNPFGYHVVNFIIHFLNGILLYYVIARLLQIDGQYDPGQVYAVSMLAAFIWSLHPIQIQSVTYVVQRMNSLCALFYLAAFYLFLGFYKSNGISVFRPLLVVFFSLLSIASKQNGVLVGLSILLVLFVYGNPFKDHFLSKTIGILWVGAFCVVALAFLDAAFEWSSVYSGYEFRDFTKGQRLLTQPRVLLFYLYQLFVPSSGLYSIAHSFSVSTSLISPASTLLSIFCIGGLVMGACAAIYKGYRLQGFAVLFFLINHLVESTVLPLEMVYEHRNYIPSFFLFVPPCLGIVKVISSPRFTPLIRGVAVTATCFIIIHLGMSTYLRNKDWATPFSLWASAVPRGEDLARVYQNLSTTYSAKTIDGLKTRVLLNMKALTLNDSTKGKQEYVSIRNIGGAYGEFGDYERAIPYLKKAYDLIGLESDALLLATVYFRMGNLDEMKGWLDRIDPMRVGIPERKKFYRMASIYYINDEDFGSARDTLINYIELGGDLTYPYALMGNMHLGSGRDALAINYLSRIDADQLLLDAYLLHAYALSGDEWGILRTVEMIESKYSVAEIRKLIRELPDMKNIAHVYRNPSLEDTMKNSFFCLLHHPF